MPSGQIIRVAVDTGADAVFDYVVPDHLGAIAVGQRVQAPFGKRNKPVSAFCVKVLTDADEIAKSRRFRLKAIIGRLDDSPLLNDTLMKLAGWISEYYFCPLGQVLSAMVPAAVKKDAGVKTQQFVYAIGVDAEVKPRGKAQRAILDLLRANLALDEQAAMDKQRLLADAGCTDAPLKGLLRSGIVKMTARRHLAALPSQPHETKPAAGRIVLNADQQKAVEHLGRQLQGGQFGVTVLHGVTDSGKTEVYIRAIEACLAGGRQAIVLLPEIALTAQTVERFSSRFAKIAVLHSGLTDVQRNIQWQHIHKGNADVVIGARSAIFAPLERLGLVVVDEEHEPGYKQDTVPRYHGRDVAIKRAQLADAHCILGSATPSLETLANCGTRKTYTLLELPTRVTGQPMPKMELVDMRQAFDDSPRKGGIVSPALLSRIREVLRRKEQVILLLNRRGYSNFVYCPSCHHTLHCMNCDVTLTFHKKPHLVQSDDTAVGGHIQSGYAICHYCLAKTLVPKQCPLCRQAMTMIGLGSQRLEEELQTLLPEAKIRRVDSDSMSGQDYYRVLDDFTTGKIDILAGTQILAKGLHFPNVTLVGIISADTSLALPDFRANERTFQLVSQVAGRAGRGDKPGQVILQTYLPDTPVLGYVMKYDFAGFVKDELEHRKACLLPPLWRMAIVHLRYEKFEQLEQAAAAVFGRLEEAVGRLGLEIKLRGPMPATISRIQRSHRMQIILQAPNAEQIQRLLTDFRHQSPVRPAVQIYADIDPVHLL